MELGITGHGEQQLRRITLAALRATEASRRSQIRSWLGEGGGPRLFEFASRNRVAPIVAHAMMEQDLVKQDPAWRHSHETSANRMAVLHRELDVVADRLAVEGIRLAVLKNGGISRGIYPCAACCPMGDVDLLVERSRFEEAHALLLECGFELATRSSVDREELAARIAEGGTEYFKRTAGEDVWCELQWRPVSGRWVRRDQEPDGGQLVARSIPVSGSAIRLLEPTDNLLQVALHTAKHTFVRAPGLRLHTDIDRLIAFAPPDWSVLVATARRLEVATPIFFSLECAKELLGTAVPDEVLHQLRPPAWKTKLIMRWLNRADVFEPDEKKFSRPGMLAMHGLLYDSAAGLAASLMDTDRRSLTLRGLPANLARGARRAIDVATRYQK